MILDIRRKFWSNFDNLQLRVEKNKRLRLLKLSFLIVKAFSKKKREEKRFEDLSELVKIKLENFKLKRIFKSIHRFTSWQHQWI